MCKMGFFRVVENGPFGLSLERAAKVILSYYLLNVFLEVLICPKSLHYIESLVPLYMTIIANIALFLAVLWDNHRLVKLWIIQSYCYSVMWPFRTAVFVLGYGNFERIYDPIDPVFVLLCHIAALIILIISTRYMFSLHRQMQKVAEKEAEISAA